MPARCSPAIAVLITTSLTGSCQSDGEAPATCTVTVDNTKRFQTWEGWEATINSQHRANNALRDLDRLSWPQPILDSVIEDAVDHLGLTALRLEIGVSQLPRFDGGVELPTNDNDDPFVVDGSGFRWHWFDPKVRCVVLPMKKRVEARGDPFTLDLHVVAWNTWHWDQPESDPGQEYAELAMAFLDRLKSEFDITPNYLTIYNEPDNGNEGPDVVIRGMKKLAERMRGAGYTTKLRFPDITRVGSALAWFDRLVATEPDLVSQIGHLSFHGYGGFDPATLNAIRARAAEHGLVTSQTEWWNANADQPRDIATCITEADVVLYQPFTLIGAYELTWSGGTFPLYDYTGWRRNTAQNWHEIRQYSGFIRPGDVRIQASSSSPEIMPVAFENSEGLHCVVMHSTAQETHDIEIRGMAAGTYSVVLTDAGHQGEALSPLIARDGEAARLRLAGGGTVTLEAQARRVRDR